MLTKSSTSTVLLATLITGFNLVSSKQHDTRSANKIQSSPFTACIDDSDCIGLGNNYACFQYICYPWSDDSRIPEMYRKARCNGKDDCEPGQICYRHYDRRRVLNGLCMGESLDCSENGDRDCPQKCCNRQFCCEEEYFLQLQSLPCHQNHLSCRDLGYGQFCCPPKSNSTSDYCCDVDPNPPPPTQKPQASRGGDGVNSGSVLEMTTVWKLAFGLMSAVLIAYM